MRQFHRENAEHRLRCARDYVVLPEAEARAILDALEAEEDPAEGVSLRSPKSAVIRAFAEDFVRHIGAEQFCWEYGRSRLHRP